MYVLFFVVTFYLENFEKLILMYKYRFVLTSVDKYTQKSAWALFNVSFVNLDTCRSAQMANEKNITILL